jgi:hypothetical protein
VFTGSDLFRHGLGRREMLMACGRSARLQTTKVLDSFWLGVV